VLVSVTVTGQKDRIVMGLQKDTSIFDQNNQELIRHFSNENAPISLGIIFDTSDSMWGKIERSREPVVQFLRRSNPEDEFSLVGINDRPELLVDFTSSVDEIQDAFLKVKPGGTTALFDAIYLGLDPMKKARNKRKVLLIVSDSEDNHSRYTKKEVWSVVREADVQIYALGIFDDAPRTKAERAGPDILRDVASVTGGRTFPIYS
jgi:Ca-activated chloride channel family protein